ncbi:hypothetical protein ACQP2E_15525 [Actinoplanes sp. CA-015351]|uniref:hypothetical protein n=1 Tax=Actinoplanes sp. CA-015351 TaxID=3239897 RepID=UPI003D992C9C
MNQDMLDQLIGAAPPSTVDVGAVIVRTRRRQRLRRIGASSAAAVAVVVAVLAGVSLTASPQQPAPPVAAAPSPSPAAPSPSAATKTPEKITLARVRQAWETATAEHATGLNWIYMPDVPGEKRTPDGQPAMWDEGEDAFAGRSGITRDGMDGKGGFYLWLRPIGCGQNQSCSELYDCDGGASDCTTTRTKSGLDLVRYVDEPGKGWVFYGVDIRMPGGKQHLSMTVVNYFGGDGSAPVTAVPLVTRGELEAIATAIADELAG